MTATVEKQALPRRPNVRWTFVAQVNGFYVWEHTTLDGRYYRQLRPVDKMWPIAPSPTPQAAPARRVRRIDWRTAWDQSVPFRDDLAVYAFMASMIIIAFLVAMLWYGPWAL